MASRCLASGMGWVTALSGKIFPGSTTKGALILGDFMVVSVRRFWIVFLWYPLNS